MVLGDGPERICPAINLRMGSLDLLTLILLRIERKNLNLLAVHVLLDENLDNVLVLLFVSSDVRNVSGGTGMLRNIVGASNDSHCARVLDIGTTADHIAQRSGHINFCKKGVRKAKTAELSKDFRRATDSLIEVVTAREVIVVKGAAKAALDVSIGIAENGGPRSDMSVVELDKKADGNSSAKVRLSRSFARTRDENACKDASCYGGIVSRDNFRI